MDQLWIIIYYDGLLWINYGLLWIVIWIIIYCDGLLVGLIMDYCGLLWKIMDQLWIIMDYYLL